MKRKPLTADEALKHDVPYPAFSPVILFDRSPLRKFLDFVLRRKGVK